MSKRTLPRSMRVTSAVAILVVSTICSIVALGITTVPALAAGIVVVLIAALASAFLFSEELRAVRRRFAGERVALAQSARDRQVEHTNVDVAHSRQLADRISTLSQSIELSESEVARLRREMSAAADYVDELEERLATARELNAMLGARPEIDPAIVTPAVSQPEAEVTHVGQTA